MRRLPAFILSATAVALTASSARAQTAPPTFQGDPDVYKVIFEDQNFRVIAATRKKGVHDKAHAHPLPSIVYNVRQQVSAGARASPSWSGVRRRPTRAEL